MSRRWGIVIAAATLGACASSQLGASDANLARARTTAPKGSALFNSECAPCHGERGESASRAPRVLGEGALPEYPRARNVNASPSAGDPESLRLEAQSRPVGAPWRDPFRTARDLHNYVSEKMPLPQEKAGSLSNEDYWAIVNFMLVAHGLDLPPGGVSKDNAAAVKLEL